MVVAGPGWRDIPAQMGRCTSGRGRARRGRRVRGARSEPAGRGHRCGRVPPDQSLARVAVSANVDSPVVGSDRGSSPGGRRGCVLRRLRLAAALAVAALLKVSLEAMAKTFVQRGRPAETVSEVILRGKAAAHGLGFPSGHAMVIFAIAALLAPYFKSWWEGTALGPGRRGLPVARVSRCALPVGRHRWGGSGHVHRGRAEPRIPRAQLQLQHCPRQRITVSSRARLVETWWMLLSCEYARVPHSAIRCP